MHQFTTFICAVTALVCVGNATAEPLRDLPKRYLSMCDASAGVALTALTFAVANDEDNVIRVFSNARGGTPLGQLDLTRFLNVQNSKHPETDFEGATWMGNQVFWITSHGRNKNAKNRPSRHRFFATTVNTNVNPPRLSPIGAPYRRLQKDLLAAPQLQRFGLRLGSHLAPKSPGGFNIEGLCSTPKNELLIAFRNPVPRGFALLVPMTNPNQVVRGSQTARFGDPILLDLGGLGIRDIARWKGFYLIVAGSYKGGGRSMLYRWNGKDTRPTRLDHIDLATLNPEAIIPYPQQNKFQILSDDGTALVGGMECKEHPSVNARSFRSIMLSVDDVITTPKRNEGQ